MRSWLDEFSNNWKKKIIDRNYEIAWNIIMVLIHSMYIGTWLSKAEGAYWIFSFSLGKLFQIPFI